MAQYDDFDILDEEEPERSRTPLIWLWLGIILLLTVFGFAAGIAYSSLTSRWNDEPTPQPTTVVVEPEGVTATAQAIAQATGTLQIDDTNPESDIETDASEAILVDISTPVATPTPLPTSTLRPTTVPTATPTKVAPTMTVSTATVAPTITSRPSPTPEATSTPIVTPPDTPTGTPLPTSVPPTATLTSTPEDTATSIPTETLTPVNTATPLPTETPSPVATYTPLPTYTAEPTFTPFPTLTSTAIPTETPTPLPSPTPLQPTATPTNNQPPTTNPQPSANLEDARPPENGRFFAAYNDTIQLDGRIEDWSNRPTAWRPIKAVVYGGQHYDGPADLSAGFQAAWSDEGLYLALIVLDDLHRSGPNNQELWQGDSLEIHFDQQLRADFDGGTTDADDYQIGINYGPHQDYVNAYRWAPANVSGPIPVKGAISSAAGGYIVEFLLAWDVFGLTPGEIGPEQVYGFNLSVNDNDSDQPAQQTLISASPQRTTYNNPTEWGTLLFTP